MFRPILIAAALLAFAGTLDAASDATPKAARKVCASERQTGSHLSRRSCTTEAERAERRKRDQDDAQRLRGPAQPPPAAASAPR